MRLLPRLAVLLVAAGSLFSAAASAADEAAPPPQHPPASEVISKAVAWAKWHREQQFYKRWRFEHLNTTRKLTDDEGVDATETRSFEVYPLAGEQFYETVRRDGKPLSAADLRKEEKRKREFLEKARKKASGKGQSGEDDSEFEFDRELVSRYQAEVTGTEQIGGRTAYVVRFEPKPGPLPVRRRTDHALNRSHGRLWIDSTDFVVLQVEFELLEPVRMWGGILGSLSRLSGRLTMTELGGGAWHYKSLDIHMKGRVVLNSFHEDQRMEWKNFEPIEAAAGE
jgi:hypothetical protein